MVQVMLIVLEGSNVRVSESRVTWNRRILCFLTSCLLAMQQTVYCCCVDLISVLWRPLAIIIDAWTRKMEMRTSNVKYRKIMIIFTARCTLVQSAVLRSHVVCLSVRLSVRPSVTLVNCDSKIISRSVSLGCSLFATQTSRVYSKGNTLEFSPR